MSGGPRSKRLLLGPGHRPPPRSGCPLKLLAALALSPYLIVRALIGDR